MNETLDALLVNGSIPLTVTVNTSMDWSQFIMNNIVVILASFGIFLILWVPGWIANIKSGSLRKITKLTKRNVVMIKHTETGLFNASMINEETLRQITMVMNKMGGKPFDLILHTPGGDIFSSLAISRMIKQYPGAIRAIIPLYSMSGGSLLALSSKELLMTPNSCLGPIDPQLGSLWRFGSARSWEEIVKFKGKKAEDQSISFAMIGKQYTKSIQNHLLKVIDFDLSNSQKTKLINFLTDGSIEHAYPLTIKDLNGFGLNPKVISQKKFLKVLSEIVSSSGKEGVTYYRKKKRWLW